jgi:hypothetical protein
LELFLHAAGREDPELIEVEATAVVRELLAGTDPEGVIWIEEINEPVGLDITLEQATIGHRHHVHRGRCRQVEVAVRFNTSRVERSFSPGTTIKTVYRWASGPDGFKLTPEQAAKHVLAVPGADHFLGNSVHIGSLVPTDSCKVDLDLLPRDRFAG